jgi:hypothetical protein
MGVRCNFVWLTLYPIQYRSEVEVSGSSEIAVAACCLQCLRVQRKPARRNAGPQVLSRSAAQHLAADFGHSLARNRCCNRNARRTLQPRGGQHATRGDDRHDFAVGRTRHPCDQSGWPKQPLAIGLHRRIQIHQRAQVRHQQAKQAPRVLRMTSACLSPSPKPAASAPMSTSGKDPPWCATNPTSFIPCTAEDGKRVDSVTSMHSMTSPVAAAHSCPATWNVANSETPHTFGKCGMNRPGFEEVFVSERIEPGA